MKILKNIGINFTGLRSVKFVLTSSVQKISHSDSHRMVNVKLKPNFTFDEIYFTPTTGEVSIEPRKDYGYDVTISLVNPQLSPLKSMDFSQLDQKDFIFFLKFGFN